MVELFSELDLKPDERKCGSCFQVFHVNSFYKDGTNPDGTTKYRRDCKNCYRITRLKSRRAKRAPIVEIPAKRRGRKRK